MCCVEMGVNNCCCCFPTIATAFHCPAAAILAADLMWVRRWAARLSDREKLRPQPASGQLNGRSPVCMRKCLDKCSMRLNTLLHPSLGQLNRAEESALLDNVLDVDNLYSGGGGDVGIMSLEAAATAYICIWWLWGEFVPHSLEEGRTTWGSPSSLKWWGSNSPLPFETRWLAVLYACQASFSSYPPLNPPKSSPGAPKYSRKGCGAPPLLYIPVSLALFGVAPAVMRGESWGLIGRESWWWWWYGDLLFDKSSDTVAGELSRHEAWNSFVRNMSTEAEDGPEWGIKACMEAGGLGEVMSQPSRP